MEVVVDTNVLFTFFWPNSTFAGMLEKDLALSAPELALAELRKYRTAIMRRAGVSEKIFDEKIKELRQFVIFVALEEYGPMMRQAMTLGKDLPDAEAEEFVDDLDFFALALFRQCPIWTNDKIFKKQTAIPVFTTKEMVELLG